MKSMSQRMAAAAGCSAPDEGIEALEAGSRQVARLQLHPASMRSDGQAARQPGEFQQAWRSLLMSPVGTEGAQAIAMGGNATAPLAPVALMQDHLDDVRWHDDVHRGQVVSS